jgi:hypothetical protein
MCGKPLCALCATEADGRMFCSAPEHRALFLTHTRLVSFTSMFEAEWVCANLRNDNIHAEMFAFRLHPGYYGLRLGIEAVLFVPRDQKEKAEQRMHQFSEQNGL